MLKSLALRNFTAFQKAEFEFGEHLNVIIGENGLGKTHILKGIYSVLSVLERGSTTTGNSNPTKTYLQIAFANKLRGVFKPDEIGRLARRQTGRSRSELEFRFDEHKYDLEFSFNTWSKSEVSVDQTPSSWSEIVPVYLPTRELLTIYPGFVSLYDTTHLQFEETWRDTSILLGAPLTRGPREETIRSLLMPLEKIMGGTVELDNSGRFYLKTQTGRLEMHLVAEGLRKLAMIARLIATGSLMNKGYLFWDEPEANLNPKITKSVAKTILEIADNGIQVFIATHSLFLLRELHILLQQEYPRPIRAQFFGLHKDKGGVKVMQGSSMEDIGDITVLDEELAQSERYMEIEDQLTTSS
jgi:hypothetical protein